MNAGAGARPLPSMSLIAFAVVGMLDLIEHYGVLMLLLFVAVGFGVEWAPRRWGR